MRTMQGPNEEMREMARRVVDRLVWRTVDVKPGLNSQWRIVEENRVTGEFRRRDIFQENR